MHKRRVATAALLLALVGAACSGGNKPVQVLGESFTRSSDAPSTTAAIATSSTTATTIDPTTTSSSEPATSAPPDTSEPETTVPAPASVTVNYQPHDGGTATATLEETGDTKSLETGSAVFGDLSEGTYTVHVTIEQPGSDPSTGTATYINRSRPIELHPGDNAVVTCDDSGCSTGVL